MRRSCQLFVVEAKTTLQKRKKISEESCLMVAVELIGDFCSKKQIPSNTKQYRGQRRHQIDYVKSHGRCKRCYEEEKSDRKVFIKCSDCDIYCHKLCSGIPKDQLS